jgi:hypothetical protein
MDYQTIEVEVAAGVAQALAKMLCTLYSLKKPNCRAARAG